MSLLSWWFKAHSLDEWRQEKFYSVGPRCRRFVVAVSPNVGPSNFGDATAAANATLVCDCDRASKRRWRRFADVHWWWWRRWWWHGRSEHDDFCLNVFVLRAKKLGESWSCSGDKIVSFKEKRWWYKKGSVRNSRSCQIFINKKEIKLAEWSFAYNDKLAMKILSNQQTKNYLFFTLTRIYKNTFKVK